MQNDVRERLIQTMFESLYQEGYHACNLNDLLQRAGSSKGGLYHYFGSKKELALMSIQLVLEAFIDHFWQQGLQRHEDPVIALEVLLKELPQAHFSDRVAFDFRYGCPLNTMIQELSAADEEFFLLLASLLERWAQSIHDAFDQAKKKKYIRDDVDTQQLARFIIASIQGTITLVKASRDKSAYAANNTALIDYLHSFRSLKKVPSRAKHPSSQSLFEL